MKLRKLRKLRNYLVIASHHASEIHIDIKRGLCAGIPACCIYFYMVTFSTMCSYEQVLPRGEIGPWRKYMKCNSEGFFFVACPLCKFIMSGNENDSRYLCTDDRGSKRAHAKQW